MSSLTSPATDERIRSSRPPRSGAQRPSVCAPPWWHAAVAAALLLALPGGAQKSPATQKVAPLYNVRIAHDFPDPEETFQEVRKLILENYYTDDLDEQSLLWAAIQGMLTHISPEENKALAAIWTPEQYAKIRDSLEGVQHSIGIKSSFNAQDGSLTVTEVFPGGPSESLLLPYDRILRIDGIALKGMPVGEIDNLLRGDPGSRVSLKVVRDLAVFDMAVERAKVKVDNLLDAVLPGEIAYYHLVTFSEGISTDLKERIEALDPEHCAGVIIDVRDNGGGVFSEALKCSELFVKEKASLMRIVSRGKVQNYVSANPTPFSFPLVVLVNQRSASCSEITAAALRDSVGAVLVGTRTFGKASMEKTFTLDSEYRVRLTNAALYSPKGHSWHKKGLLPDFPVEQDVALFAKTRRLSVNDRLANDLQLSVARRVLVRASAAP